MRFCLVSAQSVPADTVRFLLRSCTDRNIPYQVIEAGQFDFNPASKLHPGDLLYNASVSIIANRAEQFLYSPGVATFHSRPDGIFFQATGQPFAAAAAGVPIPPTISLISNSSELLQKSVRRLGGFPVIVKILGRSNGVGVMLAESMASLKSQLDYVLSQGNTPFLCRFIANATHWRLLVLADRVIASYRNKQIEGDFRSCGSTDPADFAAAPPPAAIRAAVKATAACGLEFAGVDVLEDPESNVWFLEANFPCYFPHAQIHAGMDISGAMIDFLADKSARLAREHDSPVETASHPIQWKAERPGIFISDSFLDAATCDHVLEIADHPEILESRGIETCQDNTGFSFEMPIRGDAVLERIRARIHAALSLDNDIGHTFRFRRYSTSDSHRPHLDTYAMAGRSLIATAIVYLTDTEAGGETSFPKALPEPVCVEPRRGKLLAWQTCRPDGTIMDEALHESLAVRSGTKASITYFFYRMPRDSAASVFEPFWTRA